MIHQGSEQAMDTEETAASRATLGRELGAEVFPPAAGDGQAPLGFVYVPESAFSPCHLCPLAGPGRMGPPFPPRSGLPNRPSVLPLPTGPPVRADPPPAPPCRTGTHIFRTH